jgi:hypothetical protein
MRSFSRRAVTSVVLFMLPAGAVAADVCQSFSSASPAAVQAQCAQRIAAAACRTGSADRVTSVLAKKLGLTVERLTATLNRFQVPTTKRWCGLTVAQISQILATAGRPKADAAEHRKEWIRFTLGDENGYIPPDGLARALEQRQALVPSADEGRRRIGAHSAALPATPAGWTNLSGYIHPVGRVNDLLIHPTSTNTMWAGTDGGGIWKTTDGGTTWQASNDFLASLSISSLVMRPGDPSTIYAGTGPIGTHTGLPGVGVLKSIDGGGTWSLLPSTSPALNPDWQTVFQLAIHPTSSDTVMAATWGGAYITTNGGTDWTEIPAASTLVNNVAIHPANANLRVIAMDDGTVRITTDGSTYNPYTIAASSGSSYTRIALAPSNQNIMYALVLSAGTTTLYRSATGGTSWSPVPTPTSPVQVLRGQLYYTGGLWVDPTNPNHIAVVEFWAGVTSDASVPSPVWATAANGWVDFHGVVSDPGYNGTSNKKAYFFDDGGLYRWNDVDTINSLSPSFLSPNGMVVTQVYSAAGRGGNVVLGAQDVASRYYRTAAGDPAQKWRFASLGGHDGAATAADSTNPAILYGSTQFLGIHRSSDGGVTNAFICQGITDITCGGYTGNAAFIAPFVLDPNNQSRMLAGAVKLWRSNDVSSGSPPTWTAIHSGTGTNSRITAIAIAKSDSNVVWIAYSNGSVYKTANATDVAPAWTQVLNVPFGSKLAITIDRTNSQRVYIGLAGFFPDRLVTTPDAGANWANVSGLPSASVFTIEQHPVNASWLYAGTAVGLFASENSGSTWSASNEGPATVEVRDLKWYSESPAVLLAGTFGRGVWKATVTPVLTPPTGLTATATGTASVSLAWNTSGAASYVVYRSSTFPTFAPIATTGATNYIDTTALAGKSYLYAVRASDGVAESAESNRDLATTLIFTDPTLTAAVTAVKAVHMTELRTAVDAVRTLAVLPAATYTPPAIASGAQIRRLNLTELRTALDAARSTLGLTAASYTDPTITAGSTPVKAAHLVNVRQGVQ